MLVVCLVYIFVVIQIFLSACVFSFIYAVDVDCCIYMKLK